jgi:hypothetical protein
MPSYHVCFWSGDRDHVVGCDIRADDDHGLMEGFTRAGRYALVLRRRSLPALGRALRPTPVEFAWLSSAARRGCMSRSAIGWHEAADDAATSAAAVKPLYAGSC